ncbi:MAG TPA: aldehyde dehydrogenase family protein [candidate division Zixibacteria bacterium]|nr:aldehyde dehydrogenase family protein [candidate division Zixibacteria bacterium]
MATTTPRMKITYATLSADNEELQAAFDAAVERVRGELGRSYPMIIGAEERRTEQEFEDRSPIDTEIVVSRFPVGTRQDVRDAIAAARAAYPAWRDLGWRKRIELMRRAADLISERQFEYAALMAFEVGKNRLEALGDVEETADLLRYYSDEMERNDGFVKPMGSLSPEEHTRSVLKPHGVWAVISPFNFPMALAGGPAAGALIAGNTVVMKPSSDAPLLAWHFVNVLREVGVPAGVANLVTGPGETVGAELEENPGIDGMVFTGSYEVGMKLYRGFTREYPRPIITEMGGKNPAIVTASADLDEAAEGVMRSAFGFDGQKCSAASRVYVERSVARDFVNRLVERTRSITVGDPTRRENWMGPVINERALRKFTDAVEEARRDGGTLAIGGEVLRDGDAGRGYYPTPTVVTGLPLSHRLYREELFVPLLVVGEVDSLDEALEQANGTQYGLTAGIYSRRADEIRRFLDAIQAGVVYVNRRAGATTGAWPGIQSFGGWKGSGSSGKGGLGPYYVQQFLREQSQTVMGQEPPEA